MTPSWLRSGPKSAARNAATGASRRAERGAKKPRRRLREALRQEALLKFDRRSLHAKKAAVQEGLQPVPAPAELADPNRSDRSGSRAARINTAAWPRELPPEPRSASRTSEQLALRRLPPRRQSGSFPSAARQRNLPLGHPVRREAPHVQDRRSESAPLLKNTPLTGRWRLVRTARPSPPADPTATSPSGTSTSRNRKPTSPPSRHSTATSGRSRSLPNTVLWATRWRLRAESLGLVRHPPEGHSGVARR